MKTTVKFQRQNIELSGTETLKSGIISSHTRKDGKIFTRMLQVQYSDGKPFASSTYTIKSYGGGSQKANSYRSVNLSRISF